MIANPVAVDAVSSAMSALSFAEMSVTSSSLAGAAPLPPTARIPMPRPLLLALIVACALFMESLDATVISTSLPVIAAALGESPIALKLALTAYLVSLAVFIPVSGWFADRYGARRVFRAAIVVFTLGSVACGFASSLGGFVVARFLQGMGGAMMVPVGRLLLMKSVAKDEMVTALSYLTIPALLGPVFGPLLGGFISTYFDWRWIFFINVPIALLGLYFAGRYIPNLREEQTWPLDLRGFVLSGLGLSLLTLGLATAGQHLLSGELSAACAAGGALLLAAYVRHARGCAHPLLDFRFLQVPTYRVSVLGGWLFRLGVGATPFLLPLLLQLGLGMSPLQSGALTCVSALAAIGMKTLSARILRRFGFRSVLTVNALIASLVLAVCGLFDTATPVWLLLCVLLASGFFRSLQFTALNAICYADIERVDMGPASGLANVAQQLALSAGVTVGAFMLEASAALHGHASVAIGDFAWAFLGVSLLSAAAAWPALRLPADAGAEVSGHRAA